MNLALGGGKACLVGAEGVLLRADKDSLRMRSLTVLCMPYLARGNGLTKTM
jgi:hypothetical protein